MKKIGKFLFAEQCFADTEETKPVVVNTDYIDNISCRNSDKHGNVAVITTDNREIICKNSEEFFTEFENLISEEEW